MSDNSCLFSYGATELGSQLCFLETLVDMVVSPTDSLTDPNPFVGWEVVTPESAKPKDFLPQLRGGSGDIKTGNGEIQHQADGVL